MVLDYVLFIQIPIINYQLPNSIYKFTNLQPIFTTNYQLFGHKKKNITCLTYVISSGSAANAGKGHTKSASVSSPRPSTDGCVSVSIDPLGTRYTLCKHYNQSKSKKTIITIYKTMFFSILYYSPLTSFLILLGFFYFS